ncbi:hypothetical protein EDS67_21355 [candidate division KSB1 bacterium]|nr:MAG: hypothetical protein EDS67_21355 [candidate division KSB1 bacterium]MBC6947820.1 hypothetical protein [candidate division KSB1 bacterium]MCE7943642.1 hypothetical protein [Chlorobi bacterium CHB1]
MAPKAASRFLRINKPTDNDEVGLCNSLWNANRIQCKILRSNPALQRPASPAFWLCKNLFGEIAGKYHA